MPRDSVVEWLDTCVRPGFGAKFAGAFAGLVGVAYYRGWMTQHAHDAFEPDDNWLVMCGQNAGERHMLVNGEAAREGLGSNTWSSQQPANIQINHGEGIYARHD